MTALTAAEWVALESDPTKDKAYQLTALGPSVGDYLLRRQTEGLAERTLDTYERDLARLCVRNPDKKPVDITTRDLEALLATYPLDSRKRVRASARAFFADLCDQDVLLHDPARKLRAIRTHRQHVIDVFDENEQDCLMHMPRELRDRALTTLLLTSGLRKREALELERRDVDLDGQRLSVRKGKGRKGRVVPFPSATAAVLADLFTLEGLDREDHLWYTRYVNETTETIHRRGAGDGAFHRWWRRMCDEAGVRYRNAHVCRHTYATTLLRRGTPMHSVQRLLGHASVRTTVDLYAHLSVEDLAADVTAAFGGPEK